MKPAKPFDRVEERTVETLGNMSPIELKAWLSQKWVLVAKSRREGGIFIYSFKRPVQEARIAP